MNKRSSLFLLIRVRAASGIRLVIPLLLPVLEETIEECLDLAALVKKLSRSSRGWLASGHALLQTVLDLIRGLRAMGRYTLARVETDQVQVRVELK